MSLPINQISIEITQPGGPNVLQPTSRPMASHNGNQVVIKVAAAGVNRPDVFQRLGFYPAPPGASDIPGLEVSGTVVAAGNEVTRWKIGDQVCALLAGGGYAEYTISWLYFCFQERPNLLSEGHLICSAHQVVLVGLLAVSI